VVLFKHQKYQIESKGHILTFPHTKLVVKSTVVCCLVLAGINHLSSANPRVFFGAFQIFQTVFYLAELWLLAVATACGAACVSAPPPPEQQQRRPALAA
jgi:hypothetical protein